MYKGKKKGNEVVGADVGPEKGEKTRKDKTKLKKKRWARETTKKKREYRKNCHFSFSSHLFFTTATRRETL